MVIPDLTFSIILALAIALLFAWILRRQGPRRGFLWFFLPIFLAVFAAGIWGKPAGAPLTTSNWLPFLGAGVLMALLLSILAPRYLKIDRTAQLDRQKTLKILDEIEQEKELATLAYISLNLFFWGMIALLIVMILIRYLT